MSRIQKLEKAVQNFEDEHDICEIFSTHRKEITDEEIIESLKKEHGIEITKKHFSRWRKEEHDNTLVIMSPNFNIDKLLFRMRMESQRKQSLELGNQNEKS